jgi:hypothetical protein
MSMAAQHPGIASVAVAQTVVDQLDRMELRDAREIASAISTIGSDPGVPIKIRLPDEAEPRDYRALSTADPDLPVILYTAGAEPGTWVATALIDPETYQTYKRGERQRLLDDPAVQNAIKAGLLAAGLYVVVRAATR